MNSDKDTCSSSSDFEEDPKEDESKTASLNDPVKCLFCPALFQNVPEAFSHAKNKHDFDIFDFRDKVGLNYGGYIKLINYIRTKQPEPKDVVPSHDAEWNDEVYTESPSNDPFMWYTLPGYNYSKIIGPKYVNVEDGKITLAQSHFNELHGKIHSLRYKLHEKEDQLKALRLILTDVDCSRPKSSSSSEEESYFKSYSMPSIHNEMLQDKPRMDAFNAVFNNNRDIFKDKSILDLGCGTGILSMLAARAGAKNIVGIDESEILYQALDIVRENNLHENIHLIKGKLETQELPIKKFDVIISEWMGYFLLYEGMVSSVIYARDTYLAPGGLMLPGKASIQITAISDIDKHERKVAFWENVSGFSMSSMRKSSVQEPLIDLVKSETVVSDVQTVHNLDLNVCTPQDMNFSKDFILKINRDSMLTALAGSFDVEFDLPHPVTLSTSPLSEPTHWQHTIFFIKDPIPVVIDQELRCNISCKARQANSRAFDVTISIEGVSQSYRLF